MRRMVLAAVTLLVASCGGASTSTSPASIVPEAGFLLVPPRQITSKGQATSIEAEGHLFYNLRPAESDAADKPIIFAFNGFAAEVVRAFGTGPTTVADGGAVVANPTPLTAFANLVYLEPRQSGYSYDVVSGRAPGAADCAPAIFNEYVDAADVLFAALTFLESHPALRGPVYWMGESYAGVRITWILAYLRGRWDLAEYDDPTLAAKIARATHPASLLAGQILLEAWLVGGPHDTAIQAECTDPVEVAGVAASTGQACPSADACACAGLADRSLYNYGYTVEHQTARETEGSEAHIDPALAAALLGLPLTSISGLSASARAAGFKCSPPDDTIPAEDALVATLGPLPVGQAYYVPYSPLQPGKETQPVTPDWSNANIEGPAFVDNLHDVPTFASDGPLNLVVPNRALAPALRASVTNVIDTATSGKLGVVYPDGERFIDVFSYPSAGHMITMLDPAKLASDLQSWLPGK